MIFEMDSVKDYLRTEVKPDALLPKVDEHDELIKKCTSFIDDANTQLMTIPFSPFRTIKNWRESRNDDRLRTLNGQLQPQIHDAEAGLRTILMDAMMKKEKLQAYAQECYTQLLACIDFTNMGIFHSEPIVSELRVVVDRIASEADELKNMVSFNTAVVQQAKIQYRIQAQTPAWANRNTNNKSGIGRNRGKASLQTIRDEVARESCNDDPDNESAVARLVQLRHSRKVAMDLLAESLESKETLSSNLINCINGKNDIESKIRSLDVHALRASAGQSRKSLDASSSATGTGTGTATGAASVSASEQRPTDKARATSEREASFLDGSGTLDRDWYIHNCHTVYLNAGEILKRMDGFNQLALNANKCLQKLVELREDMNNIQSLTTAGPNSGVGSSPSGGSGAAASATTTASGADVSNSPVVPPAGGGGGSSSSSSSPTLLARSNSDGAIGASNSSGSSSVFSMTKIAGSVASLGNYLGLGSPPTTPTGAGAELARSANASPTSGGLRSSI